MASIKTNTRGIRATIRKATTSEVFHGARWYAQAHAFCATLAAKYGITHAQAIGITAALSPGVGWAQNQKDAEALCQGITTGIATYGANVRKAERILQGEAPEDVLGGLKVCSFYQNIKSAGTDPAVTIDRHAIAAAGYKLPKSGTISLGTYRAAERAYTIVGKEYGLTGAQAQAVVWLAHRRLKGVSAHHG